MDRAAPGTSAAGTSTSTGALANKAALVAHGRDEAGPPDLASRVSGLEVDASEPEGDDDFALPANIDSVGSGTLFVNRHDRHRF